MPFTATCLHCRASKFRVPYKKRGTFLICPKCHEETMLVPSSGVDVPLMDYNHLPFDADDDEPNEVQPAVENRETAEVPVEQTVADAPQPAIVVATTPPRAPDYALPTALVSLGLMGASIVASQFPYGRWVAVPLAVVGFITAALSLFGLDKLRWLGWAGMGLNSLALVLVVFLPSWLGLSGWTPASDPEAAPKPVTAVGRDGSLPKAAEWVDASQAVWEQADARVTVVSVSFGFLDPTSKDPEKKKARALKIGLKLTNVGVVRAIPFAGWTVPPDALPKLTTSSGIALTAHPATLDKVTLYPGKSVETILLFTPPEKPDDLRLELPPEAFGGTDTVRIVIPKTMILGR